MIFEIALNMVEGLKPVHRASLLRAFGTPENVFRAAEMELCSAAGIRAEMATRIIQFDIRSAEKEQEHAGRLGFKLLSYQDPRYPALLKAISDPPLVLYVRGELDPVAACIGIVGSRKATPYGLNVAQFLSKDLAAAGLTIVSGLARGVDAKAHNAAIQANGRTYAVLGSG